MSSFQNFEVYCAGKFISTSAMHTVTNPYDGSEVATTFLAGDVELDQAIKVAKM
jgi:acyl-CoA reductase-like NAD-dependent aldehyde dehydrogenase